MRMVGILLGPMVKILSAHNKRIAHPATVGGNWHLDGCKITERWWFA